MKIRSPALVALLLALAADPGLASPPPAAAFGRLPALDEVALAPDGSAWAALSFVGGEPFLLVQDVGSESAPRKMALEIRKNADDAYRSVRWLNDEVVGVVVELDGARLGWWTQETRVLAVRRDFRDAWVLPRRGESSLVGPQVSRILHLLPDDPDRILMELDPGLGTGVGVYRVDIVGGRFTSVEKGNERTFAYQVDAEGRVRLRYEIRNERVRIFARRAGSRKWKRLVELPFARLYTLGSMPFTGSGDDLWAVREDPAGYREIIESNLDDLRRGERVLGVPGIDVSEAVLDPHTHLPVGVRYVIDRSRIHYTDPRFREAQAAVDAVLTDAHNHLRGWDRLRRRFVVLVEGPTEPGRYYLYDTRANELRLLGRRYPELEGVPLADVGVLDYTARDGLDIRAYLTKPAGAPPYPTVVLPHDGPEARDQLGYAPHAQFLASRGYAVLQPNFRGSIGFGRDHWTAGRGEWGLAAQDDLDDGARVLVERGIADPARIAIVGGGYGGYAALMGAARDSDLYACAVSLGGITDLPRFLRELGRYRFSDLALLSLGHYRKDRERLRQTSPITHADSFDIPVLLVHGERDAWIPLAHSRSLATALEKENKPHRLVVLPKAGHSLDEQESRIRFLVEMESFLARSCTRGW